MSNATLAIIIPAFKSRHFQSTLASLAAQTAPARRFRVYVADDCSPEDMGAIARSFADKLDLVYHRFSENLGATSLVSHWDRAIAMSTEPWVWLFSDDDEALPEAVAGILEVIDQAHAPPPLIRLPLQVIDDQGRAKWDVQYPVQRTHEQFLHDNCNRADLFCAIQNFSFARDNYRQVGGFADLPGGMFSDLCTWPRFTREGGLRGTTRGGIRFRIHDGSLSGGAVTHPEKRRAFISAAGAYFRAMEEEYRRLPPARRIECPGLSFVAHMLKQYPRPLRMGEMLAWDAVASAAWPRFPLSKRLHLWRSFVRPWRRQIKRCFQFS